jgi:hypothetical protein
MCEMTRQPSVRRIPAACSQHPVQLGLQFSGGDAQAALVDLALFIAVAQLQSRLQQILYRSREGQRRRRGDVHHLPATIQQMGQTALMGTRTGIGSRAPSRREAETRRIHRPESVSTVHILGPAEWRIRQEPRAGFTKATGAAWRVALEARGLSAVSINVRITAVRKLAVEAADNGLLAPELANGITRVKGVASKGVRLGNWLSARQARPFSPRRTPLRRRESATGRFSQCPLATGCDVQKWRRSPWRTSSSGMGAGASWPDKVQRDP